MTGNGDGIRDEFFEPPHDSTVSIVIGICLAIAGFVVACLVGFDLIASAIDGLNFGPPPYGPLQ